MDITTTTTTTTQLGSVAEDLFIQLFCDVFGPENSQYLYKVDTHPLC